MVKSDLVLFGKYAFLLGFIIAILSGFIYYGSGELLKIIIAFVLMGIGVIVGFFNIKREQETSFLVSILTIMVSSIVGLEALDLIKGATGSIDVIPGYAVGPVLIYIGVLLAPAAVIIGLKGIFRTVTSS